MVVTTHTFIQIKTPYFEKQVKSENNQNSKCNLESSLIVNEFTKQTSPKGEAKTVDLISTTFDENSG